MFINLLEQAEREVIPGYKARFLHTENLTLVYWNIEANSYLPEHSHPHEQTVNVVSGKFTLMINGKTRIMSPGDVAIIPSNALHSGHSETHCLIIDVFYPIRKDYIFLD